MHQPYNHTFSGAPLAGLPIVQTAMTSYLLSCNKLFEDVRVYLTEVKGSLFPYVGVGDEKNKPLDKAKFRRLNLSNQSTTLTLLALKKFIPQPDSDISSNDLKAIHDEMLTMENTLAELKSLEKRVLGKS